MTALLDKVSKQLPEILKIGKTNFFILNLAMSAMNQNITNNDARNLWFRLGSNETIEKLQTTAEDVLTGAEAAEFRRIATRDCLTVKIRRMFAVAEHPPPTKRRFL